MVQDGTNRCVSEPVNICDDFEPFFMLNFQGHVAILQQNLPPRHGGFLCNFEKFFHWYIHLWRGHATCTPSTRKSSHNEYTITLTGKSAAGETFPGVKDQ
jgi:hypothetical protein